MNRTTINIMALAVTATIVYGCGTYKKYERQGLLTLAFFIYILVKKLVYYISK